DPLWEVPDPDRSTSDPAGLQVDWLKSANMGKFSHMWQVLLIPNVSSSPIPLKCVTCQILALMDDGVAQLPIEELQCCKAPGIRVDQLNVCPDGVVPVHMHACNISDPLSRGGARNQT
ncbi:hypothetical protein A2U01_0033205, partial [Trifolium medium]|nr:hypothetical protein [Trifolium medium]